MEKKDMKAAIIGGGFAGGIHASALRACGIELGAVVTRREETARAFAEKWGVSSWGTDPELAFQKEIGAVHICTPPTSHRFFAEEALKSGKSVFCEKPLCIDPEEAGYLVRLAEESGKACAVNYNVRFHMAIQRAREILRSGTFGKPLLIHGSYLQEFHILPAPYDWRYAPETAGDLRAVTEIGSHWIDTAQYVSGKKVTAVSAQFGNFFPDRVVKDGMMERAEVSAPFCGQTAQKMLQETPEKETASGNAETRLHVASEDAACVSFRYEDGAIGNVMLSEISPGRGNRLALEITCERGSLWWNEEENNVLHTAIRGEGVHSQIFAFGNGFEDTFVSLMKHFYEGGEYPAFREAAQVVEVCAAIEKSANNASGWIKV